MLVSPRVPMNAIFSLPRAGAFWSIVYIIMLAWYGPMEGYFSVVQPNLDRFGIVSCRVFTLATISSSAHGKSQEVLEPGTCVQTRSPTRISSTLPRSFSPYNGVWMRNSSSCKLTKPLTPRTFQWAAPLVLFQVNRQFIEALIAWECSLPETNAETWNSAEGLVFLERDVR